MQATPMGYRLTAESVCFPSHWSFLEKLGQALTQIHHPVPGYETALAQPVDYYFDRLKADYPDLRFIGLMGQW
ncbi:MAG TPA: heme-dependent oxidative N-demethylase subunit alpha family protein [Allocoleopsis sp.]